MDEINTSKKIFLSKEEVAKYLRIKKTSVDKLFRKKDFPKTQIGACLSVELGALNTYIEKNQGQKISI